MVFRHWLNTCETPTERSYLVSHLVPQFLSVITQDGESPLMLAASEGETEVVSLLVKAGAALDLQNEVNRN